jgi:hypothetical protein
MQRNFFGGVNGLLFLPVVFGLQSLLEFFEVIEGWLRKLHDRKLFTGSFGGLSV